MWPHLICPEESSFKKVKVNVTSRFQNKAINWRNKKLPPPDPKCNGGFDKVLPREPECMSEGHIYKDREDVVL